MLSILLFATFLAFLLIKGLQKSWKIRKTLPPGPNGLPFIGNAIQLIKNPPKVLSSWAKQYGKVYTIHLGSRPVLVVNKVKTMKEIFGTMESTGRFQNEFIKILYGGNYGIVNAVGEAWQEQYRFCMSAMKELGFGNPSFLDPVILSETDDLCAFLDKNIETGQNEDVHFSKILMQLTSNTIWNIVTGERIKSANSKIVTVLQNWVHTLNVATKRGVVFAPWLKYVAPEKSGYNGFVKATNNLHGLTEFYISKQKEARQTAKHDKISLVPNLITAYLEKVESCTDPRSSFYGKDGELNVFHSITSLLLSGSETTASVLNWLIFYMVAKPEVQEKMHREIDQVIGANRDPSLVDRRRMPYTDAVILEALRCSSLVVFGIMHEILEEVEYDDYTLPKGLILLANIYHANNDPLIWGDPETFRPERFLVEDLHQQKMLKESVATFQEGKRRCPGEQMAKDSLFLFTAKLFQKYNFHSKAGVDKIKYVEPVLGLLLVPNDLGVHVSLRTR